MIYLKNALKQVFPVLLIFALFNSCKKDIMLGANRYESLKPTAANAGREELYQNMLKFNESNHSLDSVLSLGTIDWNNLAMRISSSPSTPIHFVFPIKTKDALCSTLVDVTFSDSKEINGIHLVRYPKNAPSGSLSSMAETNITTRLFAYMAKRGLKVPYNVPKKFATTSGKIMASANTNTIAAPQSRNANNLMMDNGIQTTCSMVVTYDFVIQYGYSGSNPSFAVINIVRRSIEEYFDRHKGTFYTNWRSNLFGTTNTVFENATADEYEINNFIRDALQYAIIQVQMYTGDFSNTYLLDYVCGAQSLCLATYVSTGDIVGVDDLSSLPSSDIEDKLTDSCFKKSLAKALGANFRDTISKIITNLNGNAKVKIAVSQTPELLDKDGNNTVDGKTIAYDYKNGIFSCSILLNESILNSSTQEYAVATIIHETLHAWLQYKAGNTGSHDQNHEEIAKNYIDPFVNILRSIFPNLSAKDATALAWGGLEGTSLWQDGFKMDTFKIGGTEETMSFSEMKGLENAHHGGFAENSTPKCAN